jgi:flagellar M-ring protein FliF
VPATAGIGNGAQALQPAQGGVYGGAARRDAVTQYEVDKTVRVTRNATGTLRRLNAAVVVNHRSSTDAKGKVTSAALSAEELEKITALVQQSLGFNQERGDSVRVINAPFRIEPAPKADETPIHQQPWLHDLLRAAAAPLALALVALLVVFKLIRPALTAALDSGKKPVGSQLDVVADDDTRSALPGAASLPALAAPPVNDKLASARAFAQQNPAAVAQIVKGWVGGEA